MQGHTRATVNVTVVGSISTQGKHFFDITELWYRRKAQRRVPLLKTQWLKSSAESGELKCLNTMFPGSLGQNTNKIRIQLKSIIIL